MPLSNMTVAELQAVNRINKTTPDTFEQLGYIICELYGLTIDETNALSGKVIANKMAAIKKEVEAKPTRWTRLLKLQTDATKITFGQFIECQHWLKVNDTVQAMDVVAASLLLKRKDHVKDAARVRRLQFVKVLPQVEKFIESMNAMLLQYANLFEIDLEAKEDNEDEDTHPFIEQYSWILSATELAKHERITLDKAFDLPVLQAFNGLAYLKSKALFEKMKSKK